MSRPVAGVFGNVAPRRRLEAGAPCPPCPVPPPIDVPLVITPRLADAAVSDPSSLGTWSEVSPGRLRFVCSGFATATTQDAPAAGATLTWPITRPDGTMATMSDIAAGLGFAIAQVAGTPAVATNYALAIGITRADLSEYLFVSLDHAASVGRGGSRVSGGSYATNATAAAGKFCNLALFQRADLNIAYWAAVCGQLDDIETHSTSPTAFGPAGAPNRNSGVNLAGQRLFVSFIPRGTLASQPADIDIDFSFPVARLARKVTVTP